jgi:hypothetical protein
MKSPATQAIREGYLTLSTVKRYVMNAIFSYNYKKTKGFTAANFMKIHHNYIYVSRYFFYKQFEANREEVFGNKGQKVFTCPY